MKSAVRIEPEGRSMWFDHTEPIDHVIGAAMIRTRPSGAASKSPSVDSATTPAIPSARPTHSRLRGQSPNAPPTSDAHTGVMATAVAAMPLPTPNDSAIVTCPTPPTKRKEPTIQPLRTWRRVGPGRTADSDHRVEQRPGEAHPHCVSEERGNVLHHEAQRQIGGAPDQVDAE
jgi:hypothetical protein